MVTVQGRLTSESEAKPGKEKWLEVIEEPWTNGLPYVMSAAEGLQHRPTRINFGFQFGDTKPTRGLDFDQMSNLSAETHVSVYESDFNSSNGSDVELHSGFQGRNYRFKLFSRLIQSIINNLEHVLCESSFTIYMVVYIINP